MIESLLVPTQETPLENYLPGAIDLLSEQTGIDKSLAVRYLKNAAKWGLENVKPDYHDALKKSFKESGNNVGLFFAEAVLGSDSSQEERLKFIGTVVGHIQERYPAITFLRGDEPDEADLINAAMMLGQAYPLFPNPEEPSDEVSLWAALSNHLAESNKLERSDEGTKNTPDIVFGELSFEDKVRYALSLPVDEYVRTQNYTFGPNGEVYKDGELKNTVNYGFINTWVGEIPDLDVVKELIARDYLKYSDIYNHFTKYSDFTRHHRNEISSKDNSFDKRMKTLVASLSKGEVNSVLPENIVKRLRENQLDSPEELRTFLAEIIIEGLDQDIYEIDVRNIPGTDESMRLEEIIVQEKIKINIDELDPVDITQKLIEVVKKAKQQISLGKESDKKSQLYANIFYGDRFFRALQDSQINPIDYIVTNYPLEEMGLEPLIEILNTVENIGESNFVRVMGLSLNLNRIPIEVAAKLVDNEALNRDISRYLATRVERHQIVTEVQEEGFMVPYLSEEQEWDEIQKRLMFIRRIKGIDEDNLQNAPTNLREFIDELKSGKNLYLESTIQKVIDFLSSSKRAVMQGNPTSYVFESEEGSESLSGLRPALVDLLVVGLNGNEVKLLIKELKTIVSDDDENVQILNDLSLIQGIMEEEDEYIITGLDRTGMTSDVYFVDTPKGKYAIKAFAGQCFRDGSEVSRERSEIAAYQIPGIERHTLKTNDFDTKQIQNAIVMKRGQILDKDSIYEDGLIALDSLRKTLDAQGSYGIFNVVEAMSRFYKLALQNRCSPGFDYKANSFGFRLNDEGLQFVTYDLGDFYAETEESVVLSDFCEMLRSTLDFLDRYLGDVMELNVNTFEPLIVFGMDVNKSFPVLQQQEQDLLSRIDELFENDTAGWRFLSRVYKTAKKTGSTRRLGLLSKSKGLDSVQVFNSFDELLTELGDVVNVNGNKM